MSDSKETMVRSTKGQIEEFKSSILWKDIKRELGLWKRMFEKECLTLVSNGIDGSDNSSSVLMHLGSIHGRCAAVDYLLQLPDIFLQILEEKKDASRRNQTD